MSTGVESWTGSMMDLGPIYPFVGSETILWIVGMAVWIGWHVWQGRHESHVYAEDEKKFKGEELAKALRGERS